MAKFTDLPPELLREIASRLSPLPRPGYIRETKDLKPFCMVNNLFMNVGYSILYGDIRVEVSSNAFAIIILRSPRILMHMRCAPSESLHIHADADRMQGTTLGEVGGVSEI